MFATVLKTLKTHFVELTKRIYHKNVYKMIFMLVATGLGIAGGLPEPPQVIQKITRKFDFLKWILVWVLLLQGAGGFDPYWALLGTAVMFIIFHILYIVDRYV